MRKNPQPIILLQSFMTEPASGREISPIGKVPFLSAA